MFPENELPGLAYTALIAFAGRPWTTDCDPRRNATTATSREHHTAPSDLDTLLPSWRHLTAQRMSRATLATYSEGSAFVEADRDTPSETRGIRISQISTIAVTIPAKAAPTPPTA